MPVRLQVQDKVLCEGENVPVPRVGDAIEHEGQIVRVEAVTWAFGAGATVLVTMVLGDVPYTY
jgi:hypothetical protein